MARWDWTEADLEKALDAARKGKGAPLAKLIKATSQDDLADGLSCHPHYLPGVLYHCLGRREFRRKMRTARKDLTRKLERGDA